MNKSNLKIWSSLLLLIFEIAFLYSVLFIFKNETYAIDSVIISYITPVTVILYLILLGPFSMKGFDSKFRRHLCLMGFMMAVTVIGYFTLNLIEPLIGFFMLKIILLFIMVFMLVLQAMIISDIDSLDLQKLEDYFKFIAEFEMPFFESKEVKKTTFVIFLFKIAAVIFLSVSQIILFYICFFIFVYYAFILYIKISKHFSNDFSTLERLKKLSLVELLIYLIILSLSIFDIYPIAMILIIVSNFKIYFLKEKIQQEKYLKFLQIR